MNDQDLGPLAVALAKAQAAFPSIARGKQVTVQKKSGGTYSFKYAPLEQIIDATRGPLGANGLAVSQLVDTDALVTLLLHESGAYLEARTMIPAVADIQGLGSAITYLRRYAITAILGIATEEDDDGNRAAGNIIVTADVEKADDGSLIGIADVGTASTSDMTLRTDAQLGPVIGFRLRGDKGGILVRCTGTLAVEVARNREHIIRKRVQCWGTVTTESTPAIGKRPAQSYQVLTATKVRAPEIPDMPGVADEPHEAPSESLGFDEIEALGA